MTQLFFFVRTFSHTAFHNMFINQLFISRKSEHVMQNPNYMVGALATRGRPTADRILRYDDILHISHCIQHLKTEIGHAACII